MPSVEQLPSQRWRGIYRLPDGRKRSKTFVHKKAAERWAASEEQKVVDGRTRDPSAGKMAWGVWREQWWDSRVAEASTQRSGASKVTKHLVPRWDRIPLNTIASADVQAWVTALSRSGLAPSTVRGCYFLLSGSLKVARRDGLIETNPCTGVTLPRLPPEPERYLLDDEVEALLAAVKPLGRPYKVLVEVMLEAGLRVGEAVALHRHRIDFESRRLTVVHAWDQVERRIQPHTKWNHQRTVPMSNRLEAVLMEWIGYASPGAGARTCGFRHEPGDICRSELAVVGPRGGVVDPSNFSTRVWATALKEAGIGHARVHDLRHTWASRLVTRGVPLQRLQRWGGWETLAAMNRYAKLIDEGGDVLRDALEVDGRRGTGRGTASSTARSPEIPSEDPAGRRVPGR